MEDLIKMKVLDFSLSLVDAEITTELINEINQIFNCELVEYDGDRRSHEIIWEAQVFGLELELSQHYDKKEVFLNGNSEKLNAHMSHNAVREFTNINQEMINLLKTYMPSKKWESVV